MNEPAAPPDRRAGHFISLLPWTANDLEPVLAGTATFPGEILRGRTVLFLSDADAERLAGEDLWQACLEAGAVPVRMPFAAANREAGGTHEAGSPAPAAVWVADPPEPSHLVGLLRRAPRPVVSLRTAHNDPLRALCDYAALRRLLGEPLRVHWRGPAGPRLHGWMELATRFPMELDVELEGSVSPDPALMEFARARCKGSFHLPARADAVGRARVLLWREDPEPRGHAAVLWVPVDGAPPWDRAWDRAVAGSLLEALVRRGESVTSSREGA